MALQHDVDILRPLAERYSEIATQDVQQDRMDRYARSNALEDVRPVVLIDEVPWGEIDDDALRNRCSDPVYQSIEGRIRRALYQWDHFQVDLVIPPVFRVSKRIASTGIGIEVQEERIESKSGTYAASHAYTDQLADEEDLDKLELPTITYNKTDTEREAEAAESVFSGLLPVEIVGRNFAYNIWDRISTFRGVDKVLMDLAMRPEFMHATAKRFMEIATSMFDQLLEHDLFDTNPVLLHCTPACTAELPAADFGGKVRKQDIWGRCSAQIFAAVSPAMHDEFDLVYNQEIFGDCGLLYYACCEPMDGKIDILRERFPNLRKISITPWANPERAAEEIHGDFVLAAKPNPAFVNSKRFDPEPLAAEIRRYLEAARRRHTTCELVLKDISTIANQPENLTRWAETAESVIDEYY